MNRSAHFALAALASTVLALAGTPAHAALGGPSGIVIPYAGKLELNGALVTGTVVFRFEVLESSAPPTVCQTKEIPDVPVTNGEFAVTISGVSEACVKGKDVHLQIAVKQGLDSFVVLGKQRVTPVLGAVTSGPGDFAVTGALTANTAAVTGALTASSAALTGAVTAKSLTVVDPAVSNAPGINITTTKISAVGPILSTQNIALQPKDGQGGSGLVEVQGGLKVTGPLQADQGATVAGTLGIGYVAGTCSSFGSLGAAGLGFCACPAGTVVLGGAADCGSQGGVKGTQISTQAVNLGFGILPAQSYAAVCNNLVAPGSVQVVCARLGP